MKRKITIVRNKVTRTPGIRARCSKTQKKTKLRCTKPDGHTRNCVFKEPERTRDREAPREKGAHVSKLTKLDALQMIEDPVYRAKLLEDLRERKLRPAVESMLWYYAKGKPKEMVEHSGTLTLQQELSSLSEAELDARIKETASMLKAESKERVH